MWLIRRNKRWWLSHDLEMGWGVLKCFISKRLDCFTFWVCGRGPKTHHPGCLASPHYVRCPEATAHPRPLCCETVSNSARGRGALFSFIHCIAAHVAGRSRWLRGIRWFRCTDLNRRSALRDSVNTWSAIDTYQHNVNTATEKPKGPFIATQLNSMSSWVELRRYRHHHRRYSTVADDRQCNWPSCSVQPISAK